MKTEFTVEGMGCEACSARVEKAVRGLDGVSSAKVDLASKKLTVEHDASVDAARVIAAVDDAGYEASLR